MDSGFYQLFGQVGATIVSIISTLFVGYLLYLKEQRDRTGNEIIEMKREMNSIVSQLKETPIPGVAQILLSRPKAGEEWDRLSITQWAAGTSWEMVARVRNMDAQKQETPSAEFSWDKRVPSEIVGDIWDKVREGLEDLVKGVLPDGYFPEIRADSESFREWAQNFIKNTEHIEWFCHEWAGYSWKNSLIGKMRDWEQKYLNPVLKSQEIALLLERILGLRRLVDEDLLLERNYQNLKIENSVSHYKGIIIGFLFMGFFSIFMPLLMLLLAPVEYENLISWSSFLGFILSSLLTMWTLMKSAMR